MKAGEAVTGSGAAGTDGLMQLIKNYSRNHKVKTSITVGVIGYPNVGKSRCVRGGCRSACPPFTGPFSHTPVVCLCFFSWRQCHQLVEAIQGGGGVVGAGVNKEHSGA